MSALALDGLLPSRPPISPPFPGNRLFMVQRHAESDDEDNDDSGPMKWH